MLLMVYITLSLYLIYVIGANGSRAVAMESAAFFGGSRKKGPLHNSARRVAKIPQLKRGASRPTVAAFRGIFLPYML